MGGAWLLLVALNLPQPITGIATAQLGAISGSASGAETFSGDSAVALPAIAVDATGAEAFGSSGTVALPGLASIASGAETFAGSSTSAIAGLASTGSGAETFLGGAVAQISALAISGVGTVTAGVARTASLSLPSMSSWGIGGSPFGDASSNVALATIWRRYQTGVALTYTIQYQANLSATQGDVSVGDAIYRTSDGQAFVTIGGAHTGTSVGFALGGGSGGQVVNIQASGPVSSAILGLGSGASGLVRINQSSGRIERATSIVPGDEVVGWCDVSGNVVLAVGGMGFLPFYRGSSAPVAGTFATGDIVFQSTPVAAGKVGFVCVAGGSPGTWKPFGPIDP